MKANIEVVVYTKHQLRQALDKNSLWNGTIESAISKNKVNWLLNAPRIKEDDYCLLLGLADKKMVAFIHLLPDELNIENDSKKKVYWLIEWWVNEEYTDTVLGIYLYNEALKLTNNKTLIKSNAEKVNVFYRKQPFTPILSRKRYTIFFGLNPDSLIVKFSFLKYIKPILKITDFFVKKLIAYWNINKIGDSTKNLKYEYLSIIDNSTWEFIKPFLNHDVIKKTKDYISWQLDPKQYIQTTIPRKNYAKAKIKGYTNKVNIYSFKVISNEKPIAFISILNFNGEVYIKYFIASNTHYELAVNALIEHCIVLKVSHIFTDDANLVNAIKRKIKTVFMYSIDKTAWVHNSVVNDVENLVFTERDGHFI